MQVSSGKQQFVFFLVSLLADSTHCITGNSVLDGIAQDDSVLRDEAAQRIDDGRDEGRRLARFLRETKRVTSLNPQPRLHYDTVATTSLFVLLYRRGMSLACLSWAQH